MQNLRQELFNLYGFGPRPPFMVGALPLTSQQVLSRPRWGFGPGP